MSLAASAGEATSPEAERAQVLARWSLLMLPMLILSAAAGAVLGFWLLGRRGLEGSEPMSVQGAYGWMVWAVSTAVFLAPAAAGVVLGFRAKRHGAGRSATIGVMLNGVLLVGIPALELVNMLGD